MRTISVEKESKQTELSIPEFEKLTETTYSTELLFETPALKEKLRKKIKKRHQKGELTKQQMWFGSYFADEIQNAQIPDVVVRYISPVLGWGIFANRNFRKLEFIAEYSGLLRKYKRRDKSNAYCFEYTLACGVRTPYTIDAQDSGCISRLINHSSKPNLMSASATIEFINHVILITNEPVLKGTQLCYDYGPTYWSKRENPEEIPIK